MMHRVHSLKYQLSMLSSVQLPPCSSIFQGFLLMSEQSSKIGISEGRKVFFEVPAWTSGWAGWAWSRKGRKCWKTAFVDIQSPLSHLSCCRGLASFCMTIVWRDDGLIKSCVYFVSSAYKEMQSIGKIRLHQGILCMLTSLKRSFSINGTQVSIRPNCHFHLAIWLPLLWSGRCYILSLAAVTSHSRWKMSPESDAICVNPPPDTPTSTGVTPSSSVTNISGVNSTPVALHTVAITHSSVALCWTDVRQVLGSQFSHYMLRWNSSTDPKVSWVSDSVFYCYNAASQTDARPLTDWV